MTVFMQSTPSLERVIVHLASIMKVSCLLLSVAGCAPPAAPFEATRRLEAFALWALYKRSALSRPPDRLGTPLGP
jgi:hypothetical protein